MFDLASIKEAKNKSQEKRGNTAEEIYQEAFKTLKNFSINHNIELLREAGENLAKVIEFNKKHFDSYICLAYIFHILDNDQFALKYLREAQEIKPDLPYNIELFKEELELKLDLI